ncbi:hypothetical protein PVW46_00440 [Mameliella sp. AT18]|uniref:hypothetical protein n=1 Tax=Mameliella sp. AT18 TaxID=3028385 RepID=UPI000840FD97|nr:hypothetical protein [Mameliella sp. AT18]MDD9728366.1 hypothetical protein [Mameliella sp. AT18]ODM50133.1 hypothetical protein A9320_12400 [Ruegeria sp. PBVC088]
MDDAQRSFHKREQALRRKHIRMSQGYVTRMNRNGVIEQVPQSRMSGFGLHLVLRLAVAVMLFKMVALAWLGDAIYTGHVERLSQGVFYEKAGAWILQVDPVTRMLADFLAPVMG